MVPFLKDKKSLGYSLIGSLNNDDDDVTENDKKAKGLVGKTKALHVSITLFCTFLGRHCSTTT